LGSDIGMKRLLRAFLGWAPGLEAYVVGGAVRALVMGQEPQDVDIVVGGDALEVARRFARHVGGSFVLLDEKNLLARVVKDGQHLDIGSLKGGDLEGDLRGRDFTINAMALRARRFLRAPADFSKALIDPLGGLGDLRAGLVRMVSEENLLQDPLRLLRAYRLAAELGFRIEARTREAIRHHGEALRRSARERITEELKRLLEAPGAFRALRLMYAHGLLRVVLPGTGRAGLERLRRCPRKISDFSGAPDVSFVFELAALGASPRRLVLPRRQDRMLRRLRELRGRALRLAHQGAGPRAMAAFLIDAGELLEPALALAQAWTGEGGRWGEFLKKFRAFQEAAASRLRSPMPLGGADLVKSLGLEPSSLVGMLLRELQIRWLLGRLQGREEALRAARRLLESRRR